MNTENSFPLIINFLISNLVCGRALHIVLFGKLCSNVFQIFLYAPDFTYILPHFNNKKKITRAMCNICQRASKQVFFSAITP